MENKEINYKKLVLGDHIKFINIRGIFNLLAKQK